MQGVDLVLTEKLCQIIVINSVLPMIFQIGKVNGQLLCLITAVMPSSGELRGSVVALQNFAILIRQCDAEQTVI